MKRRLENACMLHNVCNSNLSLLKKHLTAELKYVIHKLNVFLFWCIYRYYRYVYLWYIMNIIIPHGNLFEKKRNEVTTVF